MSETLEGMFLAARSGGAQLKKHFGTDLVVTEKSMAADLVTRADRDSEKAIIEVLTKQFPDYNILSEEVGLIDKKSEWTFIVDPLDGSHNFVIGIPNFSVAIALMKSKEVMFSVVHQPMLDKAYGSEKGKGAYFEGKAVAVNQESQLTRATVSYVRNYIESAERVNALYCALSLGNVKRFLSAWSPAWDFCLLAAGKIEAIVVDASTMYDFAGGKLMVRQAGGRVSDFSGKEDSSDTNGKFVASNSTALHDELIEILVSCGYAS